MRVLFVRTFCPDSIRYGSEMRAIRFVDYFRKNLWDVDLMTLTSPNSRTDGEYIQKNFVNFYYFDQRLERVRLGAAEKFFYLLPWQLTAQYAKDIQLKIRTIVEKNQYDLIFIFKLDPVFYFLQLAKPWHHKTIIDFDDILSDLYRNFYRNIFTAVKNSFSLRLYEYKALMAFKRGLVCSSGAHSKIMSPLRKKAGIVPNVFSIVNDCIYPPSADSTRLLFVGSLDYFPNLDGLRWFFDNIWPYFKNIFSQAQLTIVGKTKKDASWLQELCGLPQDVEIIVNASSVGMYYRSCFASIVPLQNGSGTRLKILESISFNRPVLTTLSGREGLNFHHLRHLFIFKDPRSFIDAYRQLLDKDRYRKMTADALKVLETEYSPAVFDRCVQENLCLDL